MAKAAENAPTNGDLALLLAIHYNFDDRQAEAKPLLERAAKLGGSAELAKAFLGK